MTPGRRVEEVQEKLHDREARWSSYPGALELTSYVTRYRVEHRSVAHGAVLTKSASIICCLPSRATDPLEASHDEGYPDLLEHLTREPPVQSTKEMPSCCHPNSSATSSVLTRSFIDSAPCLSATAHSGS